MHTLCILNQVHGATRVLRRLLIYLMVCLCVFTNICFIFVFCRRAYLGFTGVGSSLRISLS